MTDFWKDLEKKNETWGEGVFRGHLLTLSLVRGRALEREVSLLKRKLVRREFLYERDTGILRYKVDKKADALRWIRGHLDAWFTEFGGRNCGDLKEIFEKIERNLEDDE